MKHLILAVSLCLIFGCGGKAGTSATGKVTFSDGTPLTKGVVVYSSKAGSFQGAIKQDGTYTLAGVPNGEYRVAITGAEEGGNVSLEMKYDAQGNYIQSPPATIVPLIKPKFADLENSELSKKVPGDYNITVEKPE